MTTSVLQMPLTSTHWGTYRVEVKDGRIIALHPFEYDPDPSPIGRGIIDAIDDDKRVRYPMFRKGWLEEGPGPSGGRRGNDPFIKLSWQEAEQRVADELARVRRKYGNEAIYGGSYGWASAGRFHHAQSQLHRFLNCIGGYTRSVNTYSYAAAEVAIPHILGDYQKHLDSVTSWSSIIENTELFVAFGGIPLKNGQIGNGGVGAHIQCRNIRDAAQRGVHFVNVSPDQASLPAIAQGEWLGLRPCTDTALLLGLAHILHSEGLADLDFLHRYTHGYDEFVGYLTGALDGIVKSAQWAAAITDIPAAAIENLARRMAASRTMISLSWSLTRQQYGEQPFWAGITVAAMLGQMGLAGTGVGFGFSATNNIGSQYRRLPFAAFPQGENPVKTFIPVARICDMLLNPGGQFDYNGRSYNYPDTKLIYWAGGNPFHHHQDLNRLIKAWQKPDTIITHEWCWTASALRADIILPCTTTLERQDLALSPRDPYVCAMEKIIEPVGEARDDFDIFAAITRRMGCEEAFSEGRSADQWQDLLYELSCRRLADIGLELPPMATLKRKGWHRIDVDERPAIMLENFRANPKDFPLATPSGLIELYAQKVANFGYDDSPGHAVWLEPQEWLGKQERNFPLHLICVQPPGKFNKAIWSVCLTIAENALRSPILMRHCGPG